MCICSEKFSSYIKLIRSVSSKVVYTVLSRPTIYTKYCLTVNNYYCHIFKHIPYYLPHIPGWRPPDDSLSLRPRQHQRAADILSPHTLHGYNTISGWKDISAIDKNTFSKFWEDISTLGIDLRVIWTIDICSSRCGQDSTSGQQIQGRRPFLVKKWKLVIWSQREVNWLL